MRVSFLTALVMLVLAAQAAPVVAEEGTFTACLTRNGNLSRGALGLEPGRRCRSNEPEVHLEMGEVTRFNFELDPIESTFIIQTDEFAVTAQCGGPELGEESSAPGLMLNVDGATTLISVEVTSSNRERSTAKNIFLVRAPSDTDVFYEPGALHFPRHGLRLTSCPMKTAPTFFLCVCSSVLA
jgi:hypothetical protein